MCPPDTAMVPASDALAAGPSTLPLAGADASGSPCGAGDAVAVWGWDPRGVSAAPARPAVATAAAEKDPSVCYWSQLLTHCMQHVQLVLHRVSHFKQLFSWDCGLACTVMALRAAGIHHCDYALIRQLCPTTSVWTIDLAHLLRRFGMDVSFFTITLGPNPAFYNESFYLANMQEDERRVSQLFRDAGAAGIYLAQRSVCWQELAVHLMSGCSLAVVLVDKRKLDPWLHAADKCLPYALCGLADIGYAGHYILLVGWDTAAGVFLARDPSHGAAVAAEGELRVSPQALDEARRAFGTDEDLLLVRHASLAHSVVLVPAPCGAAAAMEPQRRWHELAGVGVAAAAAAVGAAPQRRQPPAPAGEEGVAVAPQPQQWHMGCGATVGPGARVALQPQELLPALAAGVCAMQAEQQTMHRWQQQQQQQQPCSSGGWQPDEPQHWRMVGLPRHCPGAGNPSSSAWSGSIERSGLTRPDLLLQPMPTLIPQQQHLQQQHHHHNPHAHAHARQHPPQAPAAHHRHAAQVAPAEPPPAGQQPPLQRAAAAAATAQRLSPLAPGPVLHEGTNGARRPPAAHAAGSLASSTAAVMAAVAAPAAAPVKAQPAPSSSMLWWVSSIGGGGSLSGSGAMQQQPQQQPQAAEPHACVAATAAAVAPPPPPLLPTQHCSKKQRHEDPESAGSAPPVQQPSGTAMPAPTMALPAPDGATSMINCEPPSPQVLPEQGEMAAPPSAATQPAARPANPPPAATQPAAQPAHPPPAASSPSPGSAWVQFFYPATWPAWGTSSAAPASHSTPGTKAAAGACGGGGVLSCGASSSGSDGACGGASSGMEEEGEGGGEPEVLQGAQDVTTVAAQAQLHSGPPAELQLCVRLGMWQWRPARPSTGGMVAAA